MKKPLRRLSPPPPAPVELDGLEALNTTGLKPKVRAALQEFVRALQDPEGEAQPVESAPPSPSPQTVVRARTRGLALTLVVESTKEEDH